jgi:hypothetical protein
MLKQRKPVDFGAGLRRVDVDWKGILRDREQTFLTGNQLSAVFDRTAPGCDRTHFYPLPFAHEFTGGRWDFPELVNHDCLRSTGPRLDFPAERVTIDFCPHELRRTFSLGKSRIRERAAVDRNVMVIEWTFSGLEFAVLNFGLPFFNAKAVSFAGGVCAAVKDQAFAALAIAGAKDLSIETKGEPFQAKAVMKIRPGRKITLAYACGYDQRAVLRAASRAAGSPAGVFRAAEKRWDDYFTKIVPRFSCSDRNLERLYYYQAYTTWANLYDVPYEPFTQPYTCPWKTGAVWQWSWNTPMNSVTERWLNDKRIGAGGILLEGDNGGGLNIGTYLHPVRKITQFRGHNEAARQMGRFLKKLPRKIDLPVWTTIAHTTPNGLLGAWEFYLCSGDKQFLRRALAIMTEAEAEFSKHEMPSGLCTTSFVDEFDYSLRLKPFIKAFKKGDPEMMLKMDTPFIAIDYNCYLHALRERMIEAARILGAGTDVERLQRKNERLKSAINRRLWSEKEGYYFDADPRTMRHSKVKCLQAFSALYAGIAPKDRAERMIKRLANPAEFGTPWPCPSVSMDTPDVDPSLITYGGDIEITSGLWFTVEGLVRYGHTDLAARYLIKAIRMMTRDGPSSSYSYHCITGKYNQEKHTLAAQGTILTDLICKYIVGIHPRPDGQFEMNPLALGKAGIRHFAFGPFRFRDKLVTVAFDRKTGLKVKSRP